MTDLLDQNSVDQFRAAMRDLTDTFHKSTVTLGGANYADIDLLAGVKPVETGGDGEAHGELYAREALQETVERWEVAFNRAYLEERGLVDQDGELLITIEDRAVYNGEQFAILKLADKALFRGLPILVKMTIAR